MQLRRLPSPESLRLVTSITRPPRPPRASAPNPSAVGKALRDWADAAGAAEEPKHSAAPAPNIAALTINSRRPDLSSFITVPFIQSYQANRTIRRWGRTRG